MEGSRRLSLNRFLSLFLFQFCSTLIPRPVQKCFTVAVGNLFCLFMKRTRSQVRKNIEAVGRGRWSRERVDRLTRKTFQNYGQYLLDYMVMHRLSASNKGRWVAAEVGGEHMIEALRRGKGAICVTPHLGNWEIGGLLFAFKGGKLNVVTLDERDRETKSFREEMRGRKGIRNLYIDPKDESPVAILDAIKALRRNEIVAMLGDRAETPKTMVFEFFGRKTAFPIGAGILALATGAPVLPVFVVMQEDRKYRGIIEPPIYFDRGPKEDTEAILRRGMEKLIKMFEDYIGRYPDQWYNFYSFWDETHRVPPAPPVLANKERCDG